MGKQGDTPRPGGWVKHVFVAIVALFLIWTWAWEKDDIDLCEPLNQITLQLDDKNENV